MGLKFLILLVLAIGLLVMVKGDLEVYPDFSCHPTFDKNTKGWRGLRLLRMNMQDCKEQECTDLNSHYNCTKACSIMELGIIDPATMQMLSHEGITWLLTRYFTDAAFKPDGFYKEGITAERIAKRIHSQCDAEDSFASSVKKVEKKHCDEWGELYSCLETAWSCEK